MQVHDGTGIRKQYDNWKEEKKSKNKSLYQSAPMIKCTQQALDAVSNLSSFYSSMESFLFFHQTFWLSVTNARS